MESNKHVKLIAKRNKSDCDTINVSDYVVNLFFYYYYIIFNVIRTKLIKLSFDKIKKPFDTDFEHPAT